MIRWLWLTQTGVREGYRMRDEPVAAEAGVTCNSLRPSMFSPGELVPVSQDPGSGRLHRLTELRCG